MKSIMTCDSSNSCSTMSWSLRVYLPSTESNGAKNSCTILVKLRPHLRLSHTRNFRKHSWSNLLMTELLRVGVVSSLWVMVGCWVVLVSRVLDVKLAAYFFTGFAERGL